MTHTRKVNDARAIEYAHNAADNKNAVEMFMLNLSKDLIKAVNVADVEGLYHDTQRGRGISK